MTAHDQMRAMLDQLMGTGRNGIRSYNVHALLVVAANRSSARFTLIMQDGQMRPCLLVIKNTAIPVCRFLSARFINLLFFVVVFR